MESLSERTKMTVPMIVGVSVLVLMLCANSMLWWCIFLLMTLSCCVVGPLIVVLINVALSPKHQTGIGTTKTVTELDAFRNMLMVKKSIYLKYSFLIKQSMYIIICNSELLFID